MSVCCICGVKLDKIGSCLEIISDDVGILRRLCPRCVNRIYRKLLVKPIKNKYDIELMIACANFIRKTKYKFES